MQCTGTYPRTDVLQGIIPVQMQGTGAYSCKDVMQGIIPVQMQGTGAYSCTDVRQGIIPVQVCNDQPFQQLFYYLREHDYDFS